MGPVFQLCKLIFSCVYMCTGWVLWAILGQRGGEGWRARGQRLESMDAPTRTRRVATARCRLNTPLSFHYCWCKCENNLEIDLCTKSIKSAYFCLCVHRGRRGRGRRRGGGEGSGPAQTHHLVGCGVISGGSSLAALEAWQSQGPIRRGLWGPRQTGTYLKRISSSIVSLETIYNMFVLNIWQIVTTLTMLSVM